MCISRTFILALCTSLLLSTGSSLAAEPPDPNTPEPASDVRTSPAREGMVQRTRIFIDPETGQPSHSDAQGRTLELSPRERAMVNRSGAGLTQRTLANGAVAINLQGRFRNMLTVQVDPATGNLTSVCAIDDPVSLPKPTAQAEGP